ncbi:MAG TPA: hypothetical protein VFT98_23485, partial [Myxococcota bacterium]|nr:hypothetical protein [Myxococcota bacterium]
MIAEVGAPTFSELQPEGRKDIFSFVQGYSKGEKAARALFHGTADFFTAGLWEVIGTPAEQAINGTDVSVAVVYDATDRVKRVDVLKGEKVMRSLAPEAAAAAAEAAAAGAEAAVPAAEAAPLEEAQAAADAKPTDGSDPTAERA